MRLATAALSLVASITFAGDRAAASADAEPDLPPLPPLLPQDLDPMPTADGVDAALTGAGSIREVRVVENDDGVYEIALRTDRGWSRHPLDAAAGTGTWYTVEGLRLVDVTGDAEPELQLEYSSYRDPCGCDDGPTFASNFVVVCEVGHNGPRCSASIEVAMRDHAVELDSFTGELVISRGGVARVKVLDSEGLSRRERAAIARPRRLFRSR